MAWGVDGGERQTDKDGTQQGTNTHINTVYQHLYLKAAWLYICSNKLMFPLWKWQDKQVKCQFDKTKV